ncbi:MAG: hypothetical protein ACYS0D_11845 [Planctomycetota bacterium]|jgi:hypothetical protein
MSRVGVAVALACTVVLVVVAFVILARVREGARSIRDASQLLEIHQALIVFSAEYGGGRYPQPGLIDRLPDPYLGDVDVAGPRDTGLDTTANLFSALIAIDYFDPHVLISPHERNPVVVVDDDYDHDAYDPVAGVYWDPGFTADLVTGSNVSYGHLPLAGDRAARAWREGGGADRAMLGNRGPADAIATASSWACRRDGSWRGYFIFGDNHSEAARASAGATIGLATADNPFDFDPGIDGLDQVIAFTRSVEDGQAILQHD